MDVVTLYQSSRKYISAAPSLRQRLGGAEASHRRPPRFREREALRHCHHPSPSPPPLSLHRCQEVEEEVAVSPVEEVGAGGSRRAAVGCQGEEAGMETRGHVCWVAVGLLTQQRNRSQRN